MDAWYSFKYASVIYLSYATAGILHDLTDGRNQAISLKYDKVLW